MNLALLTISALGVIGILIQLWLTHDEVKSLRQFMESMIRELEDEQRRFEDHARWYSEDGGES